MDPAAVSPVQAAPLVKSVWNRFCASAFCVLSGELLSNFLWKKKQIWDAGEEEGLRELLQPLLLWRAFLCASVGMLPLAPAEGLLG